MTLSLLSLIFLDSLGDLDLTSTFVFDFFFITCVVIRIHLLYCLFPDKHEVRGCGFYTHCKLKTFSFVQVQQ